MIAVFPRIQDSSNSKANLEFDWIPVLPATYTNMHLQKKLYLGPADFSYFSEPFSYKFFFSSTKKFIETNETEYN